MPPSAPISATPPLPPGLRPEMPSVLRRIVESRREAVAAAQQRVSEAELQRRAAGRARRDFLAALRPAGRRAPARPAVIAELKRASPSRGRLREDFDVPALAAGYEAAGAAALSVLTEEAHFEGRLEYLQAARAATRIPLLRKDFLFSPYQVWEAAAHGADAVLLIAAMLDDEALAGLLAVSRQAGLAALCEVHDRQELVRVAALGAECIGVNNRDLHTFHVDTGRARELGPLLPAGAVAVAESGFAAAADLEGAHAAGYQAVLMGEAFMRAPNPGRALARLLGGLVKICGITRAEDAQAAVEAGGDAVGFVFAPASPRRVEPEAARAIAASLPPGVLRVGVFAGAPVEEIREQVRSCGLDRIQLHGPYTAAQGAALAAVAPVWRALAMPADRAEVAAWAPQVERFLLDSAVGGHTGGNGVAFDWQAVPELARQYPAARWVLAGGLNPGNVAEAIRQSETFAVDVASGVEAGPGRKDAAAVAAFVANARRAFQAP